jgi:hypothetical protein
LTAQFGNVLFQANLAKESAKLFAQGLPGLTLVFNGIPQYIPDFLFGASPMPAGTLLQFRLHVVVNSANDQLRHSRLRVIS